MVKKRKNTKAKGDDYERQIAKELSLWWTDDLKVRDDIFYRTSGSGARATTRAKQGMTTANSCGDLGYLDKIGKPFVDLVNIELKRGYTKELSLLAMIDKADKNNVLLDWIVKSEKEAEQSSRIYSIIIFRRDYATTCICLPSMLMGNLEDRAGPYDHPELYFKINKRMYIITSFENFKQSFSRVDFMLIAEGHGLLND